MTSRWTITIRNPDGTVRAEEIETAEARPQQNPRPIHIDHTQLSSEPSQGEFNNWVDTVMTQVHRAPRQVRKRVEAEIQAAAQNTGREPLIAVDDIIHCVICDEEGRPCICDEETS